MKSNNMKTILIAMDYDPTAQKVAETGFSLAKNRNVKIILMHVIADETYYSSLEYARTDGFMGFSNKEASHLFDDGLKKAMIQYLNKSKQHLGDESIQIKIKEGDFSEAILMAAKEIHADIIVMGSHSRRWLENIVMGSTTEEVLRLTTIPLLIVPTKKHK